MDAIEALKSRRSVRVYRDKPVPREVIEDVVDCGRLAASAINIQPWEFVAVTDAATRSRIAGITDHGKFIADAAVCILVMCRDSKYFLEDGSAATQNMLVAARAHGLGTCWVAGDKKPYAPDILRLVGAAEGLLLVSLIAMGYPGEDDQKPKRPLSDVLHWEKY